MKTPEALETAIKAAMSDTEPRSAAEIANAPDVRREALELDPGHDAFSTAGRHLGELHKRSEVRFDRESQGWLLGSDGITA